MCAACVCLMRAWRAVSEPCLQSVTAAEDTWRGMLWDGEGWRGMARDGEGCWRGEGGWRVGLGSHFGRLASRGLLSTPRLLSWCVVQLPRTRSQPNGNESGCTRGGGTETGSRAHSLGCESCNQRAVRVQRVRYFPALSVRHLRWTCVGGRCALCVAR